MELYNTLSGQKEVFTPSENSTARIYSCGPTVYNYAHIGNLRTYLFMDWLRRALKASGVKLMHVMNITDVGHLVSDADEGEDKLEKAAKQTQKTPWEIAEFYASVFFADIDALNIERPEQTPKATEHIAEMLEITEGLVEKGYGYEITDGIYFDISKFPGYGKLSRINLDELKAGARVEQNAEKRHPADFALWKHAPREHIMQWPSRWGQGYPGWHIECSAMSRKYLGDCFDIHTGGVDHIPIHHENEIAQSEAFTGKPPARFWIHSEFMLVDGGKMSKSLGNTYTLAQLKERGYTPEHFRYFCAQAHYRNKLNFTWEGMKGSKTAYERLINALNAHKQGNDTVDPALLSDCKARFFAAVFDDLNIPKALGVVWELARMPERSPDVYALILELDAVLGLRLDSPPETIEQAIDEDISALVAARQEARKNKDFALSDKIRDELTEKGYVIRDTKDGPVLERITL